MKCISNDLDILCVTCRNMGGQEIYQPHLLFEGHDSFEGHDLRKERRLREVKYLATLVLLKK